MEETDKKNAIVVDTNVLIHDPKAIDVLREGGNTLFIPWQVILELDNLKNRPDIGIDAAEAIARIDELHGNNNGSLVIARERTFNGLKGLKKSNPDHEIIATAVKLAVDNQNKKEFKKVKLVSRDHTVRLLARDFKLERYGLTVDNYHRDETEEPCNHHPKEINVSSEIISGDDTFPADLSPEIGENEGVICYSDKVVPGCSSTEWGKKFAAIRKGDIFKIIPMEIKALGLAPQILNGNGPNWPQIIALGQLLDPEIDLVILQCGAGTGKTLLALAAAVEQRSHFQNIIVSRPMVHLDDTDSMGFLPGNEKEKMTPWLRPIRVALSFLKRIDGGRNAKLIDEMENNEKIIYESLDYIRGMTYYKDIIIVDEAQNLTPHQVKTIITRAGIGTKMIFTGDLSQIDRRRRLDSRSSGLNYAINRLQGHKLVGISTFRESVRSRLASLGGDKL